MKSLLKLSLVLIFGLFLIFVFSCKRDTAPAPGFGSITVEFSHLVNGQPVRYDTMVYVNAAGNNYMITDFQYFLSEFICYKSDGTKVRLYKKSDNSDIFYIDSGLPSTLTGLLTNDISSGTYDSISCTFGINIIRNKTGLFINAPELNMFWPDMMGGGYHFMKLNGKWKDSINQVEPCNMHIGKGMIVNGSDTTWYDNSFRVKLPGSSFTLGNKENRQINIAMNIESWYVTPHVWDWNHTGGAVMQSQTLMQMAKENGYDVFSIKSIQ